MGLARKLTFSKLHGISSLWSSLLLAKRTLNKHQCWDHTCVSILKVSYKINCYSIGGIISFLPRWPSYSIIKIIRGLKQNIQLFQNNTLVSTIFTSVSSFSFTSLFCLLCPSIKLSHTMAAKLFLFTQKSICSVEHTSRAVCIGLQTQLNSSLECWWCIFHTVVSDNSKIIAMSIFAGLAT